MALVLTAEQMKAVDRAAVEVLKVPSLLLMENAGRAVVREIERARPRLGGLEVRGGAGAGQNGGDGFVIARHLANRGARVRVLLAAPRGKVTGDAAVNATIVEAMPEVELRDLSGETDPDAWRGALAGAEVIVDAIFGTG